MQNFSCFKVTEKVNEKAPDYRLTAKVGEEYVDIGGGWIKDGKNGKFISFQLNDKEWHGTSQNGQPIHRYAYKLIKVEAQEYPTEPNPDDIGF